MEQNIRPWAVDVREQFEKKSLISASVYAGRSLFNSVWFGGTSKYPIGMNIYEREWDALLILDGCRVDALRAVAPEFDFLNKNSIEAVWSVGSASHEWTVKTFTEDYSEKIGSTALITANPFAKRVHEDRIYPPYSYETPFDFSSWKPVHHEDFAYTEWCFEQVHDHKDLFSAPPARHMTDRAIIAGREQDVDRLLIHYFQPHRPFIDKAVETGNLDSVDDYPYSACQEGKISTEKLWDRYLDNLRYALREVQLLLSNLDAERVVITADHGELMGEWGQYGHPEGIPHPSLKKVPWTVTNAVDKYTHTPDQEISYEDDYDPEQHLRELGYL